MGGQSQGAGKDPDRTGYENHGSRIGGKKTRCCRTNCYATDPAPRNRQRGGGTGRQRRTARVTGAIGNAQRYRGGRARCASAARRGQNATTRGSGNSTGRSGVASCVTAARRYTALIARACGDSHARRIGFAGARSNARWPMNL